MWMQYFVISILTLSQREICHSNGSFNTACDFKTDPLTGKVIFTSADILPVNEGGRNVLLSRLFREVPPDDLPPNADFSTTIEVAFIVDTDGSIIGERIVSGKSDDTGKMILKIVKQFKWKPAVCNGKKVAMLDSISIRGCSAEN